MSDPDENKNDRRNVLKLLGGTAVILPLAGLAGCSGGQESQGTADAAASKDAPAETQMALIDENGSQAKALGYVHDASDVDTEKYSRFQDGQACSNCALYTGGDRPKGGCSIFPGKAVKAGGWCNVYAPRAG